MTNLRRILGQLVGCIGVLIVFSSAAYAQQASVVRNANLHADPSTKNPALELLSKGTTLTILDPIPQAGFYHVSTTGGREGWVWAKNVTVVGASASSIPTSTECDDSLWDHVYNPQRLIKKQDCIAVTGTIVDATNGKRPDGVRHEPDGDTHGWLSLDPQFKNLLNAGNMSAEGGNLVFEIVCIFNVSQADAKASCPPSFHNKVQLPPLGSHVRIVGTYVQDTNHSRWMEIHPVTSITATP